MRVAWFSPIPPIRSGVAEYCEGLLPHFGGLIDIDLFVDDPELHSGTPLAARFPILDYREFTARHRSAPYDLNLYHMGNDLVHRFVYLTLVDNPGLVVLHEPMLHHFMLQMLTAGWTPSDYSRELDYNYGVRRENIEAIVGTDGSELSRFRYPMIQRVVDSSLGIIVHSEFARGEVLKLGPRGPVRKVNMPYAGLRDDEGPSKEKARRLLDLDSDAFLIGTFGFVTPAKRIESILDALAEFLSEAPDARLAVVGATVPEYPVGELIGSKGLSGVVLMPGYVSSDDLLSYMAACDLAVSLRWPSAGETPASLVQLLGMGCPTVVSDYKAFAEFPDDICMKVDPAREREDLLRHFRRAYSDRAMLAGLGEQARVYIAENHRVEDTVGEYADFAHSLLTGGFQVDLQVPDGEGGEDAIRGDLVDEVCEKLAAIGVGSGFIGLLEDVSSALDSIFGDGGDLDAPPMSRHRF